MEEQEIGHHYEPIALYIDESYLLSFNLDKHFMGDILKSSFHLVSNYV